MGESGSGSGYEQILADAYERFEAAEDFTVSIEEEFALLDPETLDLVNRFEEVQSAARGTELEPNLVGELIASEVEVKTGKQASFADVPAALAERRAQLAALDRSGRRALRRRPAEAAERGKRILFRSCDRSIRVHKFNPRLVRPEGCSASPAGSAADRSG